MLRAKVLLLVCSDHRLYLVYSLESVCVCILHDRKLTYCGVCTIYKYSLQCFCDTLGHRAGLY